MVRRLSLSQARRVAIAAQGLERARPATVTLRHLTDTIKRIGLLQIDSVNVLARAHLLPLFARLGPYDTTLLERATGHAPRRILETWAHEASFVPATTFPLLTWNRRRWSRMDPVAFEAKQPGLLSLVREIATEHGPLTSREIEAFVHRDQARRPEGHWGWSWSPAKTASELLFDAGTFTPARRNAQFERVFDLTERVVPPAIRETLDCPKEDAIRELVRIAVRAHGIGTVRCFADYFRFPQRDTARALGELEAVGEVIPVEVTGWQRPTWMHAGARVPRTVDAQALLAPFDPLVFERRRLLELFGMHYRLEIYTPAHKRQYGYYVLPFVLGEHLVARLDLKHDRSHNQLLVRSAFSEEPRTDAGDQTPWPDRGAISQALAAELSTMATWLGAGEVAVEDHAPGDLTGELSAALE
ncbi:winged helix-turn-helix domain-containing protein [Enteractinococcus fodinae]